MAGLKRRLAEIDAGSVVLANGCFDPLHVGHVRYLYGAKRAGDYLVVAINDDESTRELKGPHRPLIPASDRARVVSGLEMVDAVLVFSGLDVTHLLEFLRPAVHAKGTDYTKGTVPERETSAALGIKTVISGDPKSHASRDIVRRMRDRGRKRRVTAS
jgi:rfaE bifunctional protein nucleotidyltransferase chain/domain